MFSKRWQFIVLVCFLKDGKNPLCQVECSFGCLLAGFGKGKWEAAMETTDQAAPAVPAGELFGLRCLRQQGHHALGPREQPAGVRPRCEDRLMTWSLTQQGHQACSNWCTPTSTSSHCRMSFTPTRRRANPRMQQCRHRSEAWCRGKHGQSWRASPGASSGGSMASCR